MTDQTPDPKQPNATNAKERTTALARVQKLLDDANAALVAWQEKFASVGPRIADEPPEIPDTPAHRAGQAKRQRHADAVEAGEMTYKDIALERQKEFAERFANLPDSDRALLNDWGARQEARHGSPLGVIEHHAAPWPIVFMAARWGVEVEHWPTSLTAEDKARLAALDSGAKPLKLVEPLHVAAAKKATRARVYLFTAPEHQEHVDAALKAAAPAK